jgi:hypothetical protein
LPDSFLEGRIYDDHAVSVLPSAVLIRRRD